MEMKLSLIKKQPKFSWAFVLVLMFAVSGCSDSDDGTVAQEVEQEAEELAEETEELAGEAGEEAEQLVDQAGEAAEEAGQEVEQFVEGAAEETEQLVDEAGQETEQAVEEAGQETEQAVEEAGQETEQAVEEAEESVNQGEQDVSGVVESLQSTEVVEKSAVVISDNVFLDAELVAVVLTFSDEFARDNFSSAEGEYSSEQELSFLAQPEGSDGSLYLPRVSEGSEFLDAALFCESEDCSSFWLIVALGSFQDQGFPDLASGDYLYLFAERNEQGYVVSASNAPEIGEPTNAPEISETEFQAATGLQ